MKKKERKLNAIMTYKNHKRKGKRENKVELIQVI